MNNIEQQSNALWQQQLNNDSKQSLNEQFWQSYEGLITQAHLLAKQKFINPPCA